MGAVISAYRKNFLCYKLLKDNADKLNLHHLSIGMSGDYKEAINNGATYLRLGSAIFGART